MDTDILAKACRLFNTSHTGLIQLSGGHYNAVYRFPLGNTAAGQVYGGTSRYGVLRIGLEDGPVEQTISMLEWVQFLSEQGAPVAAPIQSIQGQLLERLQLDGSVWSVTACEEVEGILAERIPPGEWTDELFRSIGRAAGKLHAISKSYRVSPATMARPQWFESSAIQDARQRMESSSGMAWEKIQVLMEELKLLPTPPSDFGLIHDDLHFANFLVQPSGKVTIIDFDDCVYGWFAMDAAMALFDALVLYHAKSEADSQAFARRFMSAYLAGYRVENDLPLFWQMQIPRFLKLKEMCVYVPLIGHPECDQPGTWVGNFMHGRAERIAGDIPYIEIDFGGL